MRLSMLLLASFLVVGGLFAAKGKKRRGVPRTPKQVAAVFIKPEVSRVHAGVDVTLAAEEGQNASKTLLTQRLNAYLLLAIWDMAKDGVSYQDNPFLVQGLQQCLDLDIDMVHVIAGKHFGAEYAFNREKRLNAEHWAIVDALIEKAKEHAASGVNLDECPQHNDLVIEFLMGLVDPIPFDGACSLEALFPSAEAGAKPATAEDVGLWWLLGY